MRVRWTTHAADGLARIVNYIRKDNPEAARRVAKTIFDGVAGLRTFPQRGRIGLATDTRELVLLPGLSRSVRDQPGSSAYTPHQTCLAGLALMEALLRQYFRNSRYLVRFKRHGASLQEPQL